MRYYILVTLLLFFALSTTFGHALWIETNSKGIVGQKHEIKIFYGEYAEGIKEDTSKWYSDVKSFSLWLVDDLNNKTLLKSEANSHSFTSSFTPTRKGVYTLLIDHSTKDFPGSTRYEFLSSANIVVGDYQNGNKIPENTNTISLSIPLNIEQKCNRPVTINALVNGKPTKHLKYEIVSETGWSKKIDADTNGHLTFIPIWKGKYLIEAMQTEKTEGIHFGKPYSAIWRGATFMFEIK